MHQHQILLYHWQVQGAVEDAVKEGDTEEEDPTEDSQVVSWEEPHIVILYQTSSADFIGSTKEMNGRDSQGFAKSNI